MSFWRSKLNEEIIKKAKDGYVNACSFPVITDARFQKNGIVNSTWSQKSPELGKKRQFSKLFSLSPPTSLTSFPLRNESTETITAFGEDIEIAIYKSKNPKGDDICVLEVWSNDNILKTINLSDVDAHGMVYFDNELGGMVLNPSGTKVAYIAEAKKAKNSPFFPTKNNKANGGKDEPQDFGKEFSYTEEWGEQLVGKSQSVIAIFDLETCTVDVLQDLVPEDLCPGQLEWISDDILAGIVVKSTPYRLGLIYCSNRPSGIFELNLTTNNFELIKEPLGISCKHPKVSPNRKSMIWLETDLQEMLYPGPHEQCFRMICYNFDSKDKKIVLKIKDKFDPSVDTFAGLYVMGMKIPQKVFINDDIVIWNGFVDGNHVPILINIKESESFTMLETNHTILDVQGDKVISIEDNPLVPQTLKVGSLDIENKKLDLVNLNVPRDIALSDGIVAKKLIHSPADDPSMKFSSIYVGSEVDEAPLIVWPHGGPHSAIPWAFSTDIYYFLDQGFSCLLINYRGSISQGQSGIMSLPGHVGDQDVKDCYQAFQECLQTFPKLNQEKAVLFGGSHGGFLVTHLAGQYPDAFKAVVARNPVINISSMSTISDIGDWCFNEAGLGFQYRSPTPQELQIMYEKSPIFHVKSVKAPVYLMIGKDDLRVPPSQGIEYYRNLKGLGKQVDMNYYEDNHPLGKPINHCNVFINTVLFFKAILGME